jgi:pimeloyl-ACP methyl ester carboxylesterase
MKLKDRWVMNKNVQLHYIESSGEDKTPLLYIPGALGFAEQFVDVMEQLQPRKTVAVSLRGCGKSDAPQTGYTFEDHVSDIEAIIQHSKMNKIYLMAYSMGVPYAIEIAARLSDKVKGLIICDYSARLPKIPKDWADNVLSKGYIDESRKHFVRALQEESEEILLWDRLGLIDCPTLIIRGLKEGSLLNDENLTKYKHGLRNHKLVEFGDSGHELWVPDYQRFINTVISYLNEIDNNNVT